MAVGHGQMPRLEDGDIREEAAPATIRQIGDEAGHPLLIHVETLAGQSCQRPRHRGISEIAVAAPIMEWPLAGRVPRQKQARLSRIPEGEGEIADHPVEQRPAPSEPGREEQGGIAETGSRRQLGDKLVAIVDSQIGDQHEPPVAAAYWTRIEIVLGEQPVKAPAAGMVARRVKLAAVRSVDAL